MGASGRVGWYVDGCSVGRWVGCWQLGWKDGRTDEQTAISPDSNINQ